jgi:hypothetical protein
MIWLIGTVFGPTCQQTLSSCGTYGFEDTDGVFTTIDYPSSDTVLTGINNNGQIIGTETIVPEPSTFAMLGAAALVFFGLKRRLVRHQRK